MSFAPGTDRTDTRCFDRRARREPGSLRLRLGCQDQAQAAKRLLQVYLQRDIRTVVITAERNSYRKVDGQL